ncbi:MAG TPA: hypothetical protein VG253_29095 [Streptosporangiaceae bacterium]|nr:hypothetical protein [Streptosporangiaceae bacterium]
MINIGRNLSETISGHRTPAMRRRLVLLGKIAAEQPGKAAVIMAGWGQTITFAVLDAGFVSYVQEAPK